MKYRPTPHFLAAMAVLLSLVTFGALADDNLSWRHPTQYTDGTALNAADIDYTVIRYGNGTSTNPPTTITSLTVPAPATSAVVPRDVALAGTVCYQAATRMKDSAGGQQSAFAPSSWVCKTQTAPAPKKPKIPTNLVVQ